MSKRVVFIGSKRLGLEVLKKIYKIDKDSLVGVITIDDSNDSRTRYGHFKSFCCVENDIGMYVYKNKKVFNEIIRELNPDICIVVCWYNIIDTEILNIPSKGFIGVHYSMLPAYRGGAPIVWQIINGEQNIGYSIFYLSEEMDSGDILYSGLVPLFENDYVGDVLDRLENEVIGWFSARYIDILNGSVITSPQQLEFIRTTYCAQRYPFDGEIDWNKTSTEIYNFIRAQAKPYPGAYTYYKGGKMIIWKAVPFDVTYYGTPGQVARIDNDCVWVICGDNKPIGIYEVSIGDHYDDAVDVIKSIKTRF